MINKNAQNVFNGVSDTGNISMQDVSMQMKTKKKKKKKKKLDNIYVLVYRIPKTYSNGEKIRLKQKKKNTKLIKFWVDSISGRRFGNKTLYPLCHHRQHAFYSVFTIYIIND